MTRYIISFIIALGLIIFTGCSGVKNLTPVSLDTPTELVDGHRDSTTIADMEWWEFYTDPSLQVIITKMLDNNRDLMMASAKINELREMYGVAKAGMLPTVSALASADHETNDYYDKKHVDDPEFDLKATVNWEYNILGAQNWSKKKAGAQYLASIDAQRALRMSLIAETATAYFNLIALDNELSIVKRTLATRKEGVEQAKLRFEGGLTSETVFQQAKVEYASTAALIPDIERRLNIARNALTLLMGEFPTEEIERSQLNINQRMPNELPIGLPSTLMKRRPDIHASEQRLKAALAEVGYTYADQFPSFRISFSGGFENDDLGHLLASPFTYVIGTLTGNVFDFKRKNKRYKASVAAYEQARLTYEKDVITAFTEVNNAVSSYKNVHETAIRRSELRDASLKYVELAHLQYRAGSLAYLDVLDAQRRYFDAQVGLSNAICDEYIALVNLYKVLGGGWQQK